MMNNYELIREYRRCKIESVNLETELEENIFDFFKKYDLEKHCIELLINDDGKYVIITDYSVPHEGHIPLKILYDFCDEFGMDLNSITHECCTEYERGRNKVHYSHGNIYTISFEIRR